MQDVTSCPAYPPHYYTLVVVEDSGENLTDLIVQTELATGGNVIRIVVSDLMDNTHYLYHVIATNEFGSSHQSASMEIGMFLTLFLPCFYCSFTQLLLMFRVSPCVRLTAQIT